MGYRNYVVNKSSSIAKMTSRSQQFDSPHVMSTINNRNATATKPKPKAIVQPKISNSFGNKKSQKETSQKRVEIILDSSEEDISEFSSEDDDIPLIDLC